MRILEINKFFYLRRGAERHLLDVIDLLAKSGHEVEVFAMAHPENQPARFASYFPQYVGYHRGDSPWQKLIGSGRLFWSFEARKKMRALLKEWQPDIAHIHNMYHQLSPSILGPLRERGIPIVMTVHDYNLISPDKDTYYPEVGRHYFKFLAMRKYSLAKRLLLVLKMYWNQFFRFYERAITAYIVPSTFVKNVFVAAGIAEERITVIPHFISDMPAAASSSVPSPQKFPDTPFALYFGSLSREKNVDVLAEIFNRLEVPLVLAGTLESGLVLPESPFIRLIGQQSKAELAVWLARSACVVSASSLPETFGLIALEANAAGKPFFGLTVGAFPEVVLSGKTGLLAASVEELEALLKRFFRGELTFSSEGVATSARERFGAERYAQAIENLFTHLLKNQK
ncbi:MAG: glycosyltransferase [Candidatus Moranbacteria bacterium]|nr:glycosyltransferase [Candidatus Moranbacteria bacterium]